MGDESATEPLGICLQTFSQNCCKKQFLFITLYTDVTLGEGSTQEQAKTQTQSHKSMKKNAGKETDIFHSDVFHSFTVLSCILAMTRTQSKGGVRDIHGKAESNASRPSRALAHSQKALKDQAGKKGIVLFLPPCFNAHPLVYLLAVVTGTECGVHAEEEAAETELDSHLQIVRTGTQKSLMSSRDRIGGGNSFCSFLRLCCLSR